MSRAELCLFKLIFITCPLVVCHDFERWFCNIILYANLSSGTSANGDSDHDHETNCPSFSASGFGYSRSFSGRGAEQRQTATDYAKQYSPGSAGSALGREKQSDRRITESCECGRRSIQPGWV